MTPEENRMLGEIQAKVVDMHTDVKRICPLVDKHEEAIGNLKSSQSWIKRIMLSALGLPLVGFLLAKILGE